MTTTITQSLTLCDFRPAVGSFRLLCLNVLCLCEFTSVEQYVTVDTGLSEPVFAMTMGHCDMSTTCHKLIPLQGHLIMSSSCIIFSCDLFMSSSHVIFSCNLPMSYYHVTIFSCHFFTSSSHVIVYYVIFSRHLLSSSRVIFSCHLLVSSYHSIFISCHVIMS